MKCDQRTSCATCRFHAGDGDDVLALARTVGAAYVFLDWDRTFCTTKAGADPTKGDHALDASLLEYAQEHPGRCVVVTSVQETPRKPGVFRLWRPLSRSDSSRFGSFLDR